jgi:hypothetical protein
MQEGRALRRVGVPPLVTPHALIGAALSDAKAGFMVLPVSVPPSLNVSRDANGLPSGVLVWQL